MAVWCISTKLYFRRSRKGNGRTKFTYGITNNTGPFDAVFISNILLILGTQ